MFALRTNWNRPLKDSCDNGLATKRSMHSLTEAGHGLTPVAQMHLWCTPMPEVPRLPFAGQQRTDSSILAQADADFQRDKFAAMAEQRGSPPLPVTTDLVAKVGALLKLVVAIGVRAIFPCGKELS